MIYLVGTIVVGYFVFVIGYSLVMSGAVLILIVLGFIATKINDLVEWIKSSKLGVILRTRL